MLAYFLIFQTKLISKKKRETEKSSGSIINMI